MSVALTRRERKYEGSDLKLVARWVSGVAEKAYSYESLNKTGTVPSEERARGLSPLCGVTQ